MSEAAVPVPMPLEGVHQELNQNELRATALRDAENWLLRDGQMKVRAGVAQIGTTSSQRPNGFVGYIDGDGTPVLVMGTSNNLYAFDDATQDWVSLGATWTGDTSTHTVFEVFQLASGGGPVTTLYAQNGVNDPVKWKLGDATVTSQPTVPIAKTMMVLNDHMILGNIVDANGTGIAIGPQMISVSASLDPATGYGSNLEAQLSDTPGAIVVMAEIGNLQGVCYKTDAIYLVTASDSASPFTVELKKSGTAGPVSPRALIIATDGLQYYLARDGNVMVFDGIEPKPLGRHIQRYILNRWDIDTSHKAHGLYDDENRELVFWFPGVSSAEPNRGIKIRLDDMSLWPIRYETLQMTAAIKANLPGGTKIGDLAAGLLNLNVGQLTLTLGEYSSLGQTFLLGELGGRTLRENGTNDDGSPIVAFFETGSSGLDDPLRFKSMRFVDHLFATAEASQTVSITLKRSNYGEALVSDTSRTINVGSGGPYRTHHRFPGRKYALRVSCNATETVEWQGATAVYATQGRR